MAVDVGDVVELEVTKVVHGGDGLARHEGFVVFVHGALPRERVAARIHTVKKSHAFADLLEVHTASTQRVLHIWQEADISRPPDARAGGADFGHIDLGYQRAVKSEILVDSLVRHGRVDHSACGDTRVEPLPGDLDGRHWRSRVTLHVGPDGRAGPYAERSRTVIPVDTLPLAAIALEQLDAHHTDWSGHRQVRLVAPSGSEPRLIIDEQSPQPIVEKVLGDDFVLSDQSFWQVHQSAPETLSVAVAEALSSVDVDPARHHLDLYGGVGLFGKTLLRHFGDDASVTVVESDPLAAEYTEQNLAAHPHASAVTADVKRFLEGADRDQTYGAIILDPPRSGAKSEVVSLVATLAPQAVVYVACDPVALGRDIDLFRSAGYELRSVRGFDLFPHTHHIEAVAMLIPAC